MTSSTIQYKRRKQTNTKDKSYFAKHKDKTTTIHDTTDAIYMMPFKDCSKQYI